MVFELLPLSLATVLATVPPLTPAEKLAVALQIAQVMAFLHAQVPAITHGDLKPANVMLMNKQCKLVGFGLASVTETSFAWEDAVPQQDLPFLAPECFPDRRKVDGSLTLLVSRVYPGPVWV